MESPNHDKSLVTNYIQHPADADARPAGIVNDDVMSCPFATK
jgi:hypothetical protein